MVSAATRGGYAIVRPDGSANMHEMNRYTGVRRPATEGSARGASEWEDECEPGPVRLAVDVENRRVTRVLAYVAGGWRGAVDLDLGVVPAAEASLARTHRDPSIRRNAVFWLGQKRDPRALAYFEEVLAPK